MLDKIPDEIVLNIAAELARVDPKTFFTSFLHVNQHVRLLLLTHRSIFLHQSESETLNKYVEIKLKDRLSLGVLDIGIEFLWSWLSRVSSDLFMGVLKVVNDKNELYNNPETELIIARLASRVEQPPRLETLIELIPSEWTKVWDLILANNDNIKLLKTHEKFQLLSNFRFDETNNNHYQTIQYWIEKGLRLSPRDVVTLLQEWTPVTDLQINDPNCWRIYLTYLCMLPPAEYVQDVDIAWVFNTLLIVAPIQERGDDLLAFLLKEYPPSIPVENDVMFDTITTIFSNPSENREEYLRAIIDNSDSSWVVEEAIVNRRLHVEFGERLKSCFLNNSHFMKKLRSRAVEANDQGLVQWIDEHGIINEDEDSEEMDSDLESVESTRSYMDISSVSSRAASEADSEDVASVSSSMLDAMDDMTSAAVSTVASILHVDDIEIDDE